MNGIKPDQPLILFFLRALVLPFLLTVAIAPAAKASELVILYSNDIRGETEPCG
jgi:hypothetical protein